MCFLLLQKGEGLLRSESDIYGHHKVYTKLCINFCVASVFCYASTDLHRFGGFQGSYHPSTTSTTSPIFYSLYNDINQTKVKRKKNLFNNSSQMIVLIYIPKLLTPEFTLIYIWILQFEGNVTGQFSKVVHPYSTKMTLRGTEVAFEFQSFCCICQLAFTFCRSVKKPTELVTNRKLDRPIVIMAHMFLHQVEKHTFGCLSHNYLPQGK